MACITSLIAIPKNCDPNLTNAKGGTNLYLCPAELISGSTLSGNTTLGGGIVTAIVMSGTGKFTEFVFAKDTLVATETATIEAISESLEWTQSVTCNFSRREKAKRQAFVQLTAGRRNLACIFKDYNGLYWFFGYVNYVNVNTLVSGTDTAMYVMNLTGREPYQAPEVDSSIIAALIA